MAKKDASKRLAEAARARANDPFEQPYWNLDQYLIWLASRDPAAVLRATDRPNSGANPPIGWRMHRESNVDRQKVEIKAVQAIKGGHIKAHVEFNGKRFSLARRLARARVARADPEWFADWVIDFEGEPTFAALLMRTTKRGRQERVRPRFNPQSIAQLYPAPTPSNIRDRPDVENPDVGPFIAYYDAWYWLAKRISLRESLRIDEAGSRAEKTIRDICMKTPEKLTMWGFRKADPDAELKPVTRQVWQGLSINPLAGQPEADLRAVGYRREYGAATKGEYGPVIWTGLCFDRKQFVAAFVTGGSNGPKARAAKPDANAEQEMTNYLEALVRSNPDIRPDDAWGKCRLKFHHLGPRGSRQWRRIWPKAREQAGENRKAHPGRAGDLMPLRRKSRHD